MPTQKTFKHRVRTRMTKTGESYTAARHQLLRKIGEGPPAAPETPAPEPVEFTTSDEAMERGSGRSRSDWFALLDEWSATERKHPEIARWLQEVQGVGGWWAQSITVDYERARGIRVLHQTTAGFSVGANRTIGVDAERALRAFTDPTVRSRWLPDVELRRRPTRATLVARFDWPDPPSRFVVATVPKGPDKSTISVQHEQLPDAETAERFKAKWRERLVDLKAFLERG